MSVLTRDCDIAIVGGGLVGSVAALEAARAGFSTVVIEPSLPRHLAGRLGVDIRNVALSPASRGLLEPHVPWQTLNATPYVRMHVWEELGTSAIDFTAKEVGRDCLGWVVENSRLLVALHKALQVSPVQVLCAGLDALQIRDEGVEITVGSPQGSDTLNARLLVAADGNRSTVVKLLGAGARMRPTGQAALASVIRSELPHHNTAYQRFLSGGPVALLPGPEPDLSSLIWSQSPTMAAHHAAMPETEFRSTLTGALQGIVGEVLKCDERAVFPLTQQLADDFNPKDRVLLLGDAARAVHPLAGLGVNLGFEDVAAFAAGLKKGDPFSAGHWRAFARARKARGAMMINILAGLSSVYSAQAPAMNWLRNVGVRAFNESDLLKRLIITEAMGLGEFGRQTR
ncbi:MAG: FAD-dependent monooxygenase [Proteobacteria bacterium]|nr:FAD-dependent monooxygenase [Pseudomonadota bacterium]